MTLRLGHAASPRFEAGDHPLGRRGPEAALRSRRRRCTAALLVTVLVWVPSIGVGAQDLDVARERQEEVRRQQAALSAELDVLGADKAEVNATLDILEANAAAERRRLAEATVAAMWARSDAARATAREDRIVAELTAQRDLVRALAVEAFIASSDELDDVALFLRAGVAQDAARAQLLADIGVERQDRLGDELAELASELDRVRHAADAARLLAEAEEQAVAVRVAAAQDAADLQATFVAEVEAELERRLAEAAALAELHEDLATEIVAGELALATRLSADAHAAGDVPGGPGPAVGRNVPVVTVRGIRVDAAIAADVEALLAAAEADGIALGGGGYRDAAAQIATRRANCGTTLHDVHVKPASQCTPPTARPGHSMHELGLAIDFERDGALITTRSDPGFAWLSANAARFGFQNLPSEPWHWSVNGR